MNVIGIDPGISGAIALISKTGHAYVSRSPWILVNGRKKPDERSMVVIFEAMVADQPVTVFIEQVHAMPKQGVVSSFNFGKSLGIWIGILASHDVPYQFVTPQAWKKEMVTGVEGDDKKANAVIVAKRLFPKFDNFKKKDHNQAEALLIAEYGRRKLQGESQ